MKYFTFFFLLQLAHFHLFSQIVTIEPNKSTVNFLQASSGSITFPVEVTVNYNGVGVGANYTLNFVTGNSSNTALVGNAMPLTANPAQIASGEFTNVVKTKKITVLVTMNAVATLKNSESFDIMLAGAAAGDPKHRVVINNTPADVRSENQTAKKKDSTTIWNNITFLNAANFDFTDNFSPSYLGKLNIFAPDIKGSPWGVNAGIMRVKFEYKDSSNSTYSTDHKLMRPLDSIKHGTKYLRQFNKYTTTRSNTVWSVYAQPMFRIVSWPWPKVNGAGNKKKFAPNSELPNGIYFHAHLELLMNKANITTNVVTLQQDTSVIDTAKRISYISYLPNPLIFDRTYLNGYFGVGVTFNLDPFGNSNSRLFFQGTYGFTTDFPNWVNQDIGSTTVNVIQTRSGTTVGYAPREATSRNFFIFRAEFTQLLSTNAQLMFGVDIRGLSHYNPLFAKYIGLNVNLDAVAKIFSDKGK